MTNVITSDFHILRLRPVAIVRLLTYLKPRAAGASRSGENYKLTGKLAQSPVVNIVDPNFVIFIFSIKPVQ